MGNSSAATQLLLTLAGASVAAWGQILYRLIQGKRLVTYEPRRPVPWSGWSVVGVCAAALVIGQVCMYLMLARAGIDPSAGAEHKPGFLGAVVGAQTLSEIAAVALAICFFVWWCRADAGDLGLRATHLVYDLGVGIVAVAAIDFPLLALQSLLTRWFESKHPLLELIKREPSTHTLILGAWLAVIIAPIFEEFFFRVIIQGWLEALVRRMRRRGKISKRLPIGAIPIVGSALLFALLHASHGPDPLPLFGLGLVLGYLYHQTHRIWPGLVVHMCFNGASMALLALWLSQTKQGLELVGRAL